MLLLQLNMFALTSKCNFVLALIVLTTTASANENGCDLIDQTISTTCKALENYIKLDDGKLSQHMCGCFTTVVNANFSYCQADSYDFAGAPQCGKLFKSKEFKEVTSNKNNQVTEYIVNVLFKNILKVCSEKNEEMVNKTVNSMFKDGPNAKGLEVVFQTTLPKDAGSLFTECYREVRKLANISK